VARPGLPPPAGLLAATRGARQTWNSFDDRPRPIRAGGLRLGPRGPPVPGSRGCARPLALSPRTRLAPSRGCLGGAPPMRIRPAPLAVTRPSNGTPGEEYPAAQRGRVTVSPRARSEPQPTLARPPPRAWRTAPRASGHIHGPPAGSHHQPVGSSGGAYPAVASGAALSNRSVSPTRAAAHLGPAARG